MRRFLVVVCLVGCGGVEATKMDAQVAKDSAVDARAIDAPPDTGTPCDIDEFDGSTLNAHWSTAVGAAPTYAVANGMLEITDSTAATTPSNTNESWINDTDTDKGNQLAWANAIGGADFVLKTHIDWSSATTDLGIGAVGLTDAQGRLVAFAGMYDGGQSGLGVPYARLGGIGGDADTTYGAAEEQPGAADFRIERTSGQMKFFVDNVEVHSGASAALISNVVVLHLPYRLNATTYSFGTVDITRIELCH